MIEHPVVHASAEPGYDTLQGLRGSAQRYVKFLLASTAGYKEPMLHQDGCMDTCSNYSRQSRRQASHAKELHVHFMSHCEHHMLPFHGQASVSAYLIDSCFEYARSQPHGIARPSVPAAYFLLLADMCNDRHVNAGPHRVLAWVQAHCIIRRDQSSGQDLLKAVTNPGALDPGDSRWG